ncbi:hypothetical protein MHYP_G00279890 [Metynnis hypsauchen]
MLSVILIRPEVEGVSINMELDTGAAVSLISEELYRDKLAHVRLCNTSMVLKTYTGEMMAPEGVIKVRVKLNKQRVRLPLYVVKGNEPALFGREWLRRIRLNWSEIKTVRCVHKSDVETLETLLKRHANVFKEGLGTVKDFQATLTLKPDQQPKFLRARVVPYALRSKVEAELERLQNQGVISPVKFSEWATPIVPVIKKSGGVRICGDFKVTVNPALCAEYYPLPRIEDVFASLAGGQCFSKLDLSHAYLQVPVSEKSRQYLTITTHKGLFVYNRLPFGITSSPSIFQRVMDQVLQGLPNVHCFLDDILVTGTNDVQHLKNLGAVLSRLEEFGLRVQQEKCEFFKSSLEYLGHTIDEAGLHKSPDKVRAIVEAPAPVNTIQVLRSMFSRYGLPEVLVSDNGPQFVSDEFSRFLKANGVKHMRSAPFHPATNGLAERFVQTFKHSLKSSRGSTSLQERLDAFLLHYRNSPHSTTKETPAMLFVRQRLRTRLDLLKPNLAAVVSHAQDTQCSWRAKHSKERTFEVGDPVLVRDYRRGEEKWTPGNLSSKTGPVSYTVEVGSSQLWKRHTEQMLACHPEITKQPQQPQPSERLIPSDLDCVQQTAGAVEPPEPESVASRAIVNASEHVEATPATPQASPAQIISRRPFRVHKPPDRLNL